MPFETKLHSKLHSSLAGNMADDSIFDEKKLAFKLASSDARDVISANDGTFIRATPATVKDFEDVIHEVLSGEIRFQGQRRVENTFLGSTYNTEDLTTLVSGTVANSIKTVDTIELTAVNTSYHYINNFEILDAGIEVVASVDVQWISGATTVGVRLTEAGGGNDEQKAIDLSDGLVHRINLSLTKVNLSQLQIGIDNRAAVVPSVDTGVTKVRFTKLMIQNKTGASDPAVSDDYVSTGVLSAPYHGANVDGVKYFLSTNGNSVTDNVVTHAAGTPITDDIGYFGEIASTNKCANYNANPDAGLTNVSKAGDAASTLTRVLDATELASAGLDDVCISGYVFKLDNSGGGTPAYANVAGLTGNTNTHTLSVWGRVSAGTGDLIYGDLTGVGGALFTNTSYAKIEQSLAPAISSNLAVKALAGAVVYFILNQLEESAFSTSEIITEGSAVTRNKDDLSYPTTFIPANDFVVALDWTPTADNQGGIIVFGSGNAADNMYAYHDGSSLIFIKFISSTQYLASKTLNYIEDTTYNLKFRVDSSVGIALWIDDVKGGTTNANTGDITLGATIQIGAQYNTNNVQTGGIKNFTVHKGNYTDAQVIAL